MLTYKFQKNIPIFKCDFCGKCDGFLESTSKCDIKNRGCCWYFPKYNLVDIKNILNLNEESFIYKICNMKNSYVSQYHIRINGKFFKDDYNKYILYGNEISGFKTKFFFRICPFFGKDKCSLDFSLRPHPCNLYLCRKIIDWCKDKYNSYSEERKDYYAYCNYFDESIKQSLIEAKTDLSKNIKKSLDIIKKFDMPLFHNRNLDNLEFNKKTTDF